MFQNRDETPQGTNQKRAELVTWADLVIWADSVIWADLVMRADLVMWADLLMWADLVMRADFVMWADSRKIIYPKTLENKVQHIYTQMDILAPVISPNTHIDSKSIYS